MTKTDQAAHEPAAVTTDRITCTCGYDTGNVPAAEYHYLHHDLSILCDLKAAMRVFRAVDEARAGAAA